MRQGPAQFVRRNRSADCRDLSHDLAREHPAGPEEWGPKHGPESLRVPDATLLAAESPDHLSVRDQVPTSNIRLAPHLRIVHAEQPDLLAELVGDVDVVCRLKLE